jgi:hypothetical protein
MKSSFRPHPSQLKIHRALQPPFSGIVVLVITGRRFGKCCGAGTKILMADGKTKKVEDIKAGDTLMGVDWRPKQRVKACGEGFGELYKIIPLKSEPFVVNGEHVLALVRPSKYNKEIKFINISVLDYMNKSRSFKDHHKLFRSKINFEKKKVPIEPYFLGLWLGDGHSRSIKITTKDREIIEYLNDYSIRFGLKLSIGTSEERCSTYAVVRKNRGQKNCPQAVLRKLNLLKNKHIPEIYKFNSEKSRLELLAGLIDSDGSLHEKRFSYEFSNKNKRLIDDIIFLCKSLGFFVSLKNRTTSCNEKKFNSYRLYISGDCRKIPVKIERKRAGARKGIYSWSTESFKIERVGIGKYYGFELARQNPYYLLDNFIVNHNTTLAINEIIKIALEYPGCRIWYVALTKDQAYGIAWRLMLYPRLNKATGRLEEPYLNQDYIKKSREDKHYIEFSNGSLVEFKGVQDELFLLGHGLEFVVLDEFPGIPWTVWEDTISPMLIDSNGNALFIGSVPDPKVHNITTEFIDWYESVYFGLPRKKEKAFNFSSFENPYIDHNALKKQIERDERRGRPQDAQRKFYGKYTREFGLVFPKFNKEMHTVEPIPLPTDGVKIFGLDPHPQKPVCGIWGLRDYKDEWWIYREREFIEGSGRPMTYKEIAYEILRLEGEKKEKINLRLMDPTFGKVEQNIFGGENLFKMFRNLGLFFREGNRDRMVFWQQLTDRLVDFPHPTFHVFRSCPHTIRQISNLRWDSWASPRARAEKGPKDRWKKVDDDFVDCTKFILNSNVKPANLANVRAQRQAILASRNLLNQ